MLRLQLPCGFSAGVQRDTLRGLTLFQKNPILLSADKYQIRSNVSDKVLDIFLERIFDPEKDVNVTTENVTALKKLCNEFGCSLFDKEIASVLAQGPIKVKEVVKARVDRHDVLLERLQLRVMELERRLEGQVDLSRRMSAVERKLEFVSQMNEEHGFKLREMNRRLGDSVTSVELRNVAGEVSKLKMVLARQKPLIEDMSREPKAQKPVKRKKKPADGNQGAVQQAAAKPADVDPAKKVMGNQGAVWRVAAKPADVDTGRQVMGNQGEVQQAAAKPADVDPTKKAIGNQGAVQQASAKPADVDPAKKVMVNQGDAQQAAVKRDSPRGFFGWRSPARVRTDSPVRSSSVKRLGMLGTAVYQSTRKTVGYSQDSPLNGIISLLTRECGGNVNDQRVVKVHAQKVTLGTDCSNVVDFDSSSELWCASLVRYDFKAGQVTPTSYSIRSIERHPGCSHPKSWVFQASNDRENWETLDRRENNDELNGPLRTRNFTISPVPPGKYRYVQLQLTGKNHNGCDNLAISALEIFGYLYEPV